MLGSGVSGIFYTARVIFEYRDRKKAERGAFRRSEASGEKNPETDQYQNTSAGDFRFAAQQCAEPLPGAKTAKTEQKSDGSDDQRAGFRFGGAVGGNGKTDGKGVNRGGDSLEEKLGGAQTDCLHVAGVRMEEPRNQHFPADEEE